MSDDFYEAEWDDEDSAAWHREHDLADRVAWFHAQHADADLRARAHDDRYAWQAYVLWHQVTPDADALTPAEVREQISNGHMSETHSHLYVEGGEFTAAECTDPNCPMWISPGWVTADAGGGRT